MSQESSTWLNTMILRGCVETHGNPWWYDKGIMAREDTEGNLYQGPVPMADVNNRLFNFEVVERPLFVPVPATVETADTILGGLPVRFVSIDGRKAILADDELAAATDTVDAMAVFKSGYQGHPYRGLSEAIEKLTGDILPVFSAGLLRKRAVGWVSFTMPETLSESEMEFYPFITGSTSFDGTLATTFSAHVGIVECDNTLEMANATDRQVKVRHSRYSHLKLENARDALAILEQTGEETAKAIHDLSVWHVSETDWVNLLNTLVPFPADEDNKRGTTVALNKREKLEELYRTDVRCANWKGTALGVLQTFNTYNLHETQVRGGADRAERIMAGVLSGRAAKHDIGVMDALVAVAGTN